MKSKSGERWCANRYRFRCAALAAALTVGMFPMLGYGADGAGSATGSTGVPDSTVATSATSTAEPQTEQDSDAFSAQDIATLLNEQFHVGLGEASKIGHAVMEAAQREAISPVLLLAVIAVESGFDRYAVSVAGAVGLMQVLPSQHQDRLRHAKALWDADTNVRIGSSILHDYLKEADGDLHGALMRYSGGAKGYPARVTGRMNQIEVAFREQPRAVMAIEKATKY